MNPDSRHRHLRLAAAADFQVSPPITQTLPSPDPLTRIARNAAPEAPGDSFGRRSLPACWGIGLALCANPAGYGADSRSASAKASSPRHTSGSSPAASR